MKVKELAQFTTWKEVKRAIKFYYPTDKNDYQDVFERILSTKDRKPDKEGQEIELLCGWEEAFGETPADAYYGIHTTKYSLSFQKWDVVFNMPVCEATLKAYRPCDILAHLIWEVTYYGNENKMKKTAKNIFNRVEDIKKVVDPTDQGGG